MLYAAAALSVASVVVGNWQHSYSPFFLTERRSPEDFLVYYRGARAFWREHNFYETMIGVDSAGELPYSRRPPRCFSPRWRGCRRGSRGCYSRR